MPINRVKVYYNLVLILYIRESVLKAVIAIFIISTTISVGITRDTYSSRPES